MKKQTAPTRPLRWLVGIAKRQIPLLCIVVFCNVLLAASAVWFALLVRDVIDSASLTINEPTAVASLTNAAILLGGLIVAQLLLRFLCRIAQACWIFVRKCLRIPIPRSSKPFHALLA